MTWLRRRLWCIGIGVMAAMIALLSHGMGWLERLELVTWDMRERWLAHEAPPDLPIKLILIDQSSLDWAGEQGFSWPWPREFYKPIIEFCHAGGAKAIAFDLFFSEPSGFGQDDDDRFTAALKEGGITVLAVPPGPQTATPGTWPEETSASPFAAVGLAQWQVQHPHAKLALDSAVMSEKEIAESFTALGHVRGDQDVDSIIRRMTPIVTIDGQVLPSLSLAMHEIASMGIQSQKTDFRFEDDSLVVGSHRIPLDDEGMAILRYRKPSLRGEQRRMYQAFSAFGVIQSQMAIENNESPALSLQVFKDCYVFIGASAAGTYDLKPTPFNKAGPGVEVQAAFLDNLLNDDFMRQASEAWVWLFTIGLSVVGAMAARESRNSFQVVLAFVITLPVPWLAGMIAFTHGWRWPIVIPEFGLGLALVGGLIINYSTEGRQRRFIKHTFQHYLSPSVIEQILQDPSRLRLGGERRKVTVFFSDLAGFSGIAEKLDAEILAELLNDYLTVMTNILLEEQGTVDKYIGDAIVAFWNAPLDQPDHALRAVRAAARCQQALEEHREEYHQRLGVDLAMRIGVNTGVASVGNFGSQGRFDYTIIGHTVNLASRLEGANKIFGTNTLIAQETWRQINGRLRGREVGLVRVVGIQEPTRVYQLLPDQDAIGDFSLKTFQDALEMCQSGNAPAALAEFDRLTDDPLAQLYSEKLQKMARDGQNQWNGVWNLTEK